MAELNLATLIEGCLDESATLEGSVDLVAIGKASREMTRASRAALGTRVRREIVVSDNAVDFVFTGQTLVGEHPVPGEGSLRAGLAVVTFLESDDHADMTLVLLSGGASSLCVLPAGPLTLDDLGEIWHAALRAGVDITTLNQIRATSSLIAGGALLRYVRTRRSTSLILVDNVVSGAPWVASAMTYDYQPSSADVLALWKSIDVVTPLRRKMVQALEDRTRLMSRPVESVHSNVVVAEPSLMLDRAMAEASRRGYGVVNMGARVIGDVTAAAREWGEVVRNADPQTAVIGVGEVTVQVNDAGEGGRCQEFAWLMAKELSHDDRSSAFVARASDGRDYLPGVAGAWVDETTLTRMDEHGLDWSEVAEAHDTYPALRALGQLIDGGHTGWNLCDLYVALVE